MLSAFFSVRDSSLSNCDNHVWGSGRSLVINISDYGVLRSKCNLAIGMFPLWLGNFACPSLRKCMLLGVNLRGSSIPSRWFRCFILLLKLQQDLAMVAFFARTAHFCKSTTFVKRSKKNVGLKIYEMLMAKESDTELVFE